MWELIRWGCDLPEVIRWWGDIRADSVVLWSCGRVWELIRWWCDLPDSVVV